jgi:hypothetical protein
MNREQIAALTDRSYSTFISFVSNADEELWLFAPDHKWTTGQHTLHLLESIKPLNFALSLPGFILKWKYGTSNRATRSYEEVIERYQQRLAENNGAVFHASQSMEVPAFSEKSYLLNRLQVEYKKLHYKTLRIPETSLDSYVLPHPLMGKMPVRELIMWSAYHADHHLKTVQSYMEMASAQEAN